MGCFLNEICDEELIDGLAELIRIKEENLRKIAELEQMNQDILIDIGLFESELKGRGVR